MGCLCEYVIINTYLKSRRRSVAWILQIRFLSGIVMREQTSVGSQNNSHSVCYWTAKGSNRQKQLLAGQAATFCEPQLPPPPAVQWRTVMEKNYLSPVVVWLQISCSVCGPVWFLCTEAWIPMWRCPACTAQQRNAPSLRQHITGCCCCRPCRSPQTCSSSPWNDPRGSPRPCEAACARWCDRGLWPPRSWWSCAAARSLWWLPAGKEQRRGRGQTPFQNGRGHSKEMM